MAGNRSRQVCNLSRISSAAIGSLAVLALSGCATFDPASDKLEIDRLLAERGASSLGWDQNDSAQNRAAVKEWLTEPLTRDTAVKIALLISPRLQQVYGELGLVRADVMEAVQISNPRIGVSSLALENGPGSQLVFGVAQRFIDLLTLPVKAKLARLDYERSRYQIAAAILGVSLDVESAWYGAVASQQVADMRAAVAEALRASSDLAQRFYDAGNITELELNRERAAASEAQVDAALAVVAAKIARLELNNLLGLSGEEGEWTSTAVLSLPVAQEEDPATLQQIAQANSLELLAARKGEKVAVGAAKISRWFRLLGTTTIGYEREREVERSVIKGPTLDLELPIFNQNGAAVARSRAQLQLARARLSALELNAANAIPAAAERVRVLSEVVDIYRTALVPERETVARQSQLEQNFALIGAFEVLAARAQQFDAYQGFLEAVRDYWLARVDLMRLIGSRLPSDANASEPTQSVQDYLNPITNPSARNGHHNHGGTPAPAAMSAEPSREQGQVLPNSEESSPANQHHVPSTADPDAALPSHEMHGGVQTHSTDPPKQVTGEPKR